MATNADLNNAEAARVEAEVRAQMLQDDSAFRGVHAGAKERLHDNTSPSDAKGSNLVVIDVSDTKGGKKPVDTSWEKCLTLPWKLVEAVPLSYAKAIHDASGSREVFNEDGTMAIAGRPTTLASAAGAAQLARKRMLGLGTRRAMVVRRAGHQLRTTHAAGSPVLRRGAGSPAASGGGSGTGNPDKVVVAHMEATIKILELELQATKRLYHNAKTDAQVQREVLQRLLAEKVVVEEQLEEARVSASCARNTSIAQIRFELAEKHSEIDKILSDYTV
eukprot:jgi/Tetstr1/443370/TSEL_031385.t1